MNDINNRIRKLALLRIANIFNVPVESLCQEHKFGDHLKASKTSGLFRKNEYDQIENDVYDVANRQVYKELSSGKLVIGTVGAYCDHMARCYVVNPTDVRHVLGINETLEL